MTTFASPVPIPVNVVRTVLTSALLASQRGLIHGLYLRLASASRHAPMAPTLTSALGSASHVSETVRGVSPKMYVRLAKKVSITTPRQHRQHSTLKDLLNALKSVQQLQSLTIQQTLWLARSVRALASLVKVPQRPVPRAKKATSCTTLSA